MVDKSIVKTYLQELKSIMNSFGIIFSNRPKNNLQNLAELSMTAIMREEIIYNLEIEDYSEGPLKETQQGGTEMWVFGKAIKGKLIYIKLTVSAITRGVVCMSFHIAEHPMEFPFKNLN